MSDSTRHLSDLSVGQTARVTAVSGSPEIRQRLLEMGVTSGATVRLLGVAPLGDPIDFQVRGYRLSLRRAEAAAVAIEGS